jgi:predicted site-specific integrase-resolvase
VVIASDAVYDEVHAVPCADALFHFIRKSTTSRAFVVLGDRLGRRGFETFLERMKELGFEIVHCDQTTELSEFVFELRE